jgi:hypothetical protein
MRPPATCHERGLTSAAAGAAARGSCTPPGVLIEHFTD